MKFGKRLGAEAARGWKGTYLDYKACKRAVRQDVENQDPLGQNFEAVLQRELQKISAFFIEKEEELQAMMRTLQGREPAVLAAFRTEVLELRKYAVLNSTAVIKAVKKRNRHLRAGVGESVLTLRATEVLSQQYFFTSSKLAALATQAEILSKEVLPREDAAKTLEEYECPICLCVLQSPVVLTCAHRFCWGCLLSHCATSRGAQKEGQAGKEGKPGNTLLSAISEDSSVSRSATYGCPVCRKTHLLDLDRLQVDQSLTNFIEKLKLRQTTGSETVVLQPPSPAGSAAKSAAATSLCAVPAPCRRSADDKDLTSYPSESRGDGLLAESHSQTESEGEDAEVVSEEASSAPAPPLLPPQTGAMKGRLTVVLDLDGTLISSFTPRRAPSLPPGTKSYVVGKGAKLNPNGVLVVERPELQQFFRKLHQFAEVVLFTAGLEDYAAPICKALECHYGQFTATLFRPATVPCNVYPCVKDLSRLGRDMRRTVLVDDTPLAFLRQPDNGIPIFQFRGDVDDRVLPEAILPLLEQLSVCKDVRPILHRRFDMPRWLASHGISSASPTKSAVSAESPVKRRLELTPRKPVSTTPASARLSAPRGSNTLILSDFDKTITDCDAGERLVGELAPELAPMLATIQQPANFVPLTNAVLAEMARRGISRDKILAALRTMGTEIPAASLQLIKWADEQGIDMRLISDCNNVFINQILTGANVSTLVKEVITNAAAFERSIASDSAKDLTKLEAWGASHAGGQAQPAQESSHRLVIAPRHDEAALKPHNCPLCPANLCKGQELEALQRQMQYKRILYCGDGANDLCPALTLTAGDVVLARKGFDLDVLIRKRNADTHSGRRVAAKVYTWATHAELLQLVQRHALA